MQSLYSGWGRGAVIPNRHNGAVDILSQPVLQADHRIPYGADPSQFGDLWLPKAYPGNRRFPLIVFLHGGWWKSEYDLGYTGRLCRAFGDAGIACWSVEYRRTGSTGGGWPATFQDAAAGFDYVQTLAKTYPLDLTRVITMGHSAGGHLAFWVAGRQGLPPGSNLQADPPQIVLSGAIALAGAVDLRLTVELAGDSTFAHTRDNVYRLMGGSPAEHPERYAAGNPGDLLPFATRQVLIQGIHDDQIPPELPARWAELSRHAGSDASAHILAGIDHLDVVDPATPAWSVILAQTHRLLG